MKILLVEDDADLRQVLRLTLESSSRQGLEVARALRDRVDTFEQPS